MKLRQEIKDLLLQPENMGVLMQKTRQPFSTLRRWINTDYKDLRLPENLSVIKEITSLEEVEIFEKEDIKETLDTI